ncbi:MAG: FAD-dependent oxidoreductase [Candidatus Bathyarchaeota archaeon]|nr:FAD-dependent oxidoreductase [Candidatus Bathyarchaeota archaeon]
MLAWVLLGIRFDVKKERVEGVLGPDLDVVDVHCCFGVCYTVATRIIHKLQNPIDSEVTFMENWDLIIIGAGAAGLAAGIYGARSGLKTLLLDEKMAGGTAAEAPLVENYPGFPEIAGTELADKMTLHCKKAGAVIHDIEPVVSMDLKGETKKIKTNRAEYEATTVIIATGAHYNEIGVKGEKEFHGRGVSYCGVCDGPFFKGKHVLVVGGGNSACTTTLYLSGIVGELTLVHRREAFRAEEKLAKDVLSKANVNVLFNTEILEIKGDKVVNSVILSDVKTKQTRELPVAAVFVQVGESPNSSLALEVGVEAEEGGKSLKIDMHQRTNLSGVFAAGDVTNHPVKQVGTAVGQGITAALEAYSYIKRPYYRK